MHVRVQDVRLNASAWTTDTAEEDPAEGGVAAAEGGGDGGGGEEDGDELWDSFRNVAEREKEQVRQGRGWGWGGGRSCVGMGRITTVIELGMGKEGRRDGAVALLCWRGRITIVGGEESAGWSVRARALLRCQVAGAHGTAGGLRHPQGIVM